MNALIRSKEIAASNLVPPIIYYCKTKLRGKDAKIIINPPLKKRVKSGGFDLLPHRMHRLFPPLQ